MTLNTIYSSENGGIVLGELALLYNCRRTATVRALTTCVLWSLDRHTFRQIMISTNQSQRNMHKMFLRKVSDKSLTKWLIPFGLGLFVEKLF